MFELKIEILNVIITSFFFVVILVALWKILRILETQKRLVTYIANRFSEMEEKEGRSQSAGGRLQAGKKGSAWLRRRS